MHFSVFCFVHFCCTGPGIRKQVVEESIALNIDLMPTFVELAGGTAPTEVVQLVLELLLLFVSDHTFGWRRAIAQTCTQLNVMPSWLQCSAPTAFAVTPLVLALGSINSSVGIATGIRLHSQFASSSCTSLAPHAVGLTVDTEHIQQLLLCPEIDDCMLYGRSMALHWCRYCSRTRPQVRSVTRSKFPLPSMAMSK